MNSYNLIVFSDLSSDSEVEGATFIGGNLSGTSNYGIKLSIPASTVALQIGGSITSDNTQLNAGSLEVAGNIGAGVNVNMNGPSTGPSDHLTYAVGGTKAGNVNGGLQIPLATPPNITSIKNALLIQSSALASLAAT